MPHTPTDTKYVSVRVLRRLLKGQDPRRIIILASDSEGSHYSPLAEIAEGSYAPHPGKRGHGTGDVGHDPELTPEDLAVGPGVNQEDMVAGRPALVLYPYR